MSSLDQLDPSILWKHFSKICSIPHISKHEGQLVKYISDFADSHGLGYNIDNTGNICVIKNASRGRENQNGVILQGHLDMVPQKNDNIRHDFLKDPITPVIEGDWIKASDTTLGADNGIGSATMLAILESDTISHGPLEALFTVDEEAGMSGAHGLKNDFLKGKKLINLDTEDDSELIIGCAGGLDCSASESYPEEIIDSDTAAFTITIKGLKGGHSGIDINLGRGNAIKLLNRIIHACASKIDLRICSVNGGSVRNAIPREAAAVVTVPKSDEAALNSILTAQQITLQNEFYGSESDIKISLMHADLPEKIMNRKTQTALIKAIYACPNGVIRQSSRVHDIVETSNNLAIVNCSSGTISLHCLLRSSIKSSIDDLQTAIESALTPGGLDVHFSGGYPGWEPNPDSSLLRTMMNVYESLTGDLPDVNIVHAGLECGIIGSKYPALEMVSCGPIVQFPHSPDERVSITSVKRFWNFLFKVLDVV